MISDALDVDAKMGEAKNFKSLATLGRVHEKFSDLVREGEEIEMLQGYQALPVLAERFLGFTIPPLRADFAVRPLCPETMAAAGQEVYALVKLEEYYLDNGYLSEEVLRLQVK